MTLYDHAALKASDACAPASLLDEIAERIRLLIGIVDETNGSLNTTADRVFGQKPPQACGTSASPAVNMGALFGVHDLPDTLFDAARTNAEQANRFGGL